MQRTLRHPELLRRVFFTAHELIAIGAAITAYRKWLACSPESTAEHQDTIKLLDRFQQRLILPASYKQEVRS
jgi:hypothetical protein